MTWVILPDERYGSEIQQKLKSLASSFEGFEQSLEKRKQQRKDDERKRIQELHSSIEKLELSLKQESKRRKDASEALEMMLLDKLEALKVDVETPIFSRLEKLMVIYN